MSSVRIFILLVVIAFSACSNSSGQKQEAVFRKVREIEEIRPEKPVKIKLKRTAKDDYSWEISGDDVERVVQADRRLKEGLKIK